MSLSLFYLRVIQKKEQGCWQLHCCIWPEILIQGALSKGIKGLQFKYNKTMVWSLAPHERWNRVQKQKHSTVFESSPRFCQIRNKTLSPKLLTQCLFLIGVGITFYSRRNLAKAKRGHPNPILPHARGEPILHCSHVCAAERMLAMAGRPWFYWTGRSRSEVGLHSVWPATVASKWGLIDARLCHWENMQS